MEPAPDVDKKASQFRAFLPLVLCFSGVVAALLGLYHVSQARRATIRFEVQVEGEPVSHYVALLDGNPYHSGLPSGLGSKQIEVEAENGEAFRTNVFVWYSGVALGRINLPQSKRSLSLDVSPKLNRVSISGKQFQKVIQNCEKETLLVPVGRYEVESEFEHFKVREVVNITKRQAGNVSIHPPVSSLDLKAEPAQAEFRLEARSPYAFSVTGSTPMLITSLPQGEYRLDIWRGKYRKQMPLTIKGEATNTFTVLFDYAEIRFDSTPAGASIRSGDEVWGWDPLESTCRHASLSIL